MSEDTPRRRPTTGGLSIPNSPRITSQGSENKPDGTYTIPRTRPKRARRLSSGSPTPTSERNATNSEEPSDQPPEIPLSIRSPLTTRSINTPPLTKLITSPPPSTLPPLMSPAPPTAPPPMAPTPSARQFVNPEVPGYVGFANLPNQVHRKSVKKGFEFSLMVVGESGLGKSTLVNSLFDRDVYPDRHIPGAADKLQRTVKINASTKDIEERGVKLRLTVVDTPGFADAINNEDSFKPIIQYIDDHFEKYYQDESGLNRRNIVDTRVHCCLYFINPATHGLRPLDIAFMRAVHDKVNVVPVIAKADTLTHGEVKRLKAKILEEVKRLKIHIYQMPVVDEDEDDDYKEQCKQLKAAVPFAVVGSSQEIEVRGRRMRGRLYPWGVVEVENPDHCDFIKIRAMIITHLQDLQEVTHEVHYESFRKTRLSKSADDEQLTHKQRQLELKEAELRQMQAMIQKMQVEMTRGSAHNIPAGLPANNGHA